MIAWTRKPSINPSGSTQRLLSLTKTKILVTVRSTLKSKTIGQQSRKRWIWISWKPEMLLTYTEKSTTTLLSKILIVFPYRRFLIATLSVSAFSTKLRAGQTIRIFSVKNGLDTLALQTLNNGKTQALTQFLVSQHELLKANTCKWATPQIKGWPTIQKTLTSDPSSLIQFWKYFPRKGLFTAFAFIKSYLHLFSCCLLNS